MSSRNHLRLSAAGLLYAAVILAFAPAANALPLKEAVAKAVQNNPEVQTRYYEFRAAGEDRKISAGRYYPRIDLKAYAGREWLKSPSTDRNTYNHPGVAVELNQMLFDGFATRNEVKRANYVQQARYYDLLGQIDNTALEAVRAYMDVLRYQKLTEMAQANWKAHKITQAQIEQRVKAGVGRRVDLELATGRLALAESNWLTEVANLHDVSARYLRLVGEAPAGSSPPAAFTAVQLEETRPLADSVRDNPQFQAAVAGLMAAKAGLDTQRASNYPNLSLVARQEWDRNRLGAEGAHDNGLVQLQLNYNLFKGGEDSARKAVFAEKLNAATELRDKACRDTVQGIAIAQNDRRRLVEQIKQLKLHEQSSERARDVYRQQFDIGQRSLLDLLDTENELFEARRSRINAEADLFLADARTLAARHQLLPALSIGRSESLDDPEASDESARVVNCSQDSLPLQTLDRNFDLPTAPPAPATAPLKPLALADSTSSAPAVIAGLPPGWERKAKDFIEYWRSSWEGSNQAQYLRAYDASFKPSNKMDNTGWESFRKGRIAPKGERKITLSDVQLRAIDQQTVEAKFTQNYRSAAYNDIVQKTLVMRIRNNDYGILKESVDKGRLY